MGDTMDFPKAAMEFIRSYAFDDKKQVYTNGAELVSVLRVRQMLDHYMPQWISVEDRLPPYEWEQNALMATQDVLAINGDGQMFVGYFKVWKYDGSYTFDDGFEHDDITHWLPLPKPPEEDEV